MATQLNLVDVTAQLADDLVEELRFRMQLDDLWITGWQRQQALKDRPPQLEDSFTKNLMPEQALSFLSQLLA